MSAIISLSQIDSLDMLALLGDRERFAASVEWIGKNLRFDIVSNALYFIFLGMGVGVHSCFTLTYLLLFFIKT